jgi:ElaA protein
VKWLTYTFSELSKEQLYAILRVRQEVFVIEQHCFYLDADGVDQVSLHILGMDDKQLVAYARLIPPDVVYLEVGFGRVLVVESHRGKTMGKQLTEQLLIEAKKRWPGQTLRISAQYYLVRFYESFGFKTVGDVYDDAGIPHIRMDRPI